MPESIVPLLDEPAALLEFEATCKTIQEVDIPRLYQLETTSACNLRCPFCPRTTDLSVNHQRGLSDVMPLNQFEAVLDKMPQVKSLELFHYGEPFTHKDFDRYVAACYQRGIYTIIASNLQLATPEKVDRVFAAGLNFLVMDVDSLDPERYAQIRVGGTLDKLQLAVKHILSYPEHRRPYCVAQSIMLDGKPAWSEEQFLEWTGGRKADEIRFRFLDSMRGTVVDKPGLGPTDLCREPFYGFTVHADGNVVPCDKDWAGENIVGNIFEQSVEAIWHSPAFRSFRAAMKSENKPSMCLHCDEGKLVNLRSQPFFQVNMFKGQELQYP